jgi:hypothetical protein
MTFGNDSQQYRALLTAIVVTSACDRRKEEYLWKR